MAKKKRLQGVSIETRRNWCKITPASPNGSTTSSKDVIECATRCGSHFFEKAAMRFFKSRVAPVAYVDGRGGATFVTSEKGPDGIRAWSVRHYDPKRCGVGTVGKFQGYSSAARAATAAKAAARR